MSLTFGKKENTKTPGFLERLFKTKSSQTHDRNTSRRSTLDKTSSRAYGRPEDRRSTTELHASNAAVDKQHQEGASKSASRQRCDDRRLPSVSTARGRGSTASSSSAAAVEGPLRPVEYPATPETLLARHGARPFLDADELAALEELNEFECLVDGVDVIRAAAEHSRYFGVEPAKLWEEFFGYVDDVADYDEVINADVWREFVDRKYPC